MEALSTFNVKINLYTYFGVIIEKAKWYIRIGVIWGYATALIVFEQSPASLSTICWEVR